jgi:DNA-binding transcriptional LysR family regulator
MMQRSTRKLTLTPAGQAYLDRCASGVDSLLEAGQALMTGNREPSGLVRVAAPADFFDFFPMDWVSSFLAAHPRVMLDFVLSDARADLIAEQIDIAFRGGPMQDSCYVGRQLVGAIGDQLVASPAYIARRGVPRNLEELVRHDCLTLAHPSGRTVWRLEGAQGVEEAQVSGRLRANTAQALRKAALAGLGIALLPHMMTWSDVRAQRLVPVLQPYQRANPGISVLYPSRRHLPAAVSAFIDFVTDKIAAGGSPANGA